MPLFDLFWAMLWFFLFFAWIWLLIRIFADVFRSDSSGWVKIVQPGMNPVIRQVHRVHQGAVILGRL